MPLKADWIVKVLNQSTHIQSCSIINQRGCCATDENDQCCNDTFHWSPSSLTTVIDQNGQNRLAKQLSAASTEMFTSTAIPVNRNPGALYQVQEGNSESDTATPIASCHSEPPPQHSAQGHAALTVGLVVGVPLRILNAACVGGFLFFLRAFRQNMRSVYILRKICATRSHAIRHCRVLTSWILKHTLFSCLRIPVRRDRQVSATHRSLPSDLKPFLLPTNQGLSQSLPFEQLEQ